MITLNWPGLTVTAGVLHLLKKIIVFPVILMDGRCLLAAKCSFSTIGSYPMCYHVDEQKSVQQKVLDRRQLK